MVLLLTFLTGLLVTFLITFASDVLLARLIDEPSASIPSLCLGESPGQFNFCSQTKSSQESEEAEVYAALLNDTSLGDQAQQVSTREIVIQDETVTGDPSLIKTPEDDQQGAIFEALQRDYPWAERETFDSFRASNEQSYSMMEHPFLKCIKSTLISRLEVEEYSRSKPGIWWASFYRNYRDATGFYTLSKVGFNREMNQALVYRAFACGDTCGHGSYVLLVKDGGVWRIKTQAGIWIS
jgi:hypothetical protein